MRKLLRKARIMGYGSRSVNGGRPWRRPRRRGQAFVEFALVAPIFLALFFGVIEYALIDASIGAYDDAAVAGARVGAIDGTASANYPLVDDDILKNGIQPHVAGLVMAKIVEVDVFRASETGGCYTSGDTFPCANYNDIYLPASGWGTGTSSGWPQNSREEQLVTADYLGVRIVYQYTYLTALLATTSPALYLTAVSVQRIEPQAFQLQVPGPLVMTARYTPPGGLNMANAGPTVIWRRRVDVVRSNVGHTVKRSVGYAL
jgi:Flp pilus assembly protein TadG